MKQVRECKAALLEGLKEQNIRQVRFSGMKD